MYPLARVILKVGKSIADKLRAIFDWAHRTRPALRSRLELKFEGVFLGICNRPEDFLKISS